MNPRKAFFGVEKASLCGYIDPIIMGSEVVDDHLRLCEELLTLLKEENRKLKHRGEAPDEVTLDRKRELLPAFDASLAAMRALQEQEPHLLPAIRDKLKNAQNLIMKMLLLDRENEQLLLKVIVPVVKPEVAKPGMHTLRSIYQRNQNPNSQG
ncbi:MAG: hypothetical protein JW706_10595 [Opitutales bacterium]|nr:hypothetical protein [Opitutales bacterium]